jgi:hypothetical protein
MFHKILKILILYFKNFMKDLGEFEKGEIC